MQETLTRLAREAAGRYYGKYRGLVTRNDDPGKRARLMVRVPSVFDGQEIGWALPCLPFGGVKDQGWFAVPEVDAQVWVEFEEGNPSSPIWTGTFWQQESDVPTEAALAPPTTRLLKTPGGHLLQLDDQDGAKRFFLHHPAGTELEIDQDGNVRLTDAGGGKVTLDAKEGKLLIEDANGNKLSMEAAGTTLEDANGNKLEMAAAGIKVSARKVEIDGELMLAGQGGEPILKAQTFLALLATHVHPTGLGPSGPAVPQGESSTLSSQVKTA